jgi:3-methyladenine DNA glycosylase AlkD
MKPSELTTAVEAALVPLADPEAAISMAAYMRNKFAFLGIKAPARRAATLPLIRRQEEHVLATAEALWSRPEREYQYVACDLLLLRAASLPASAFAGVLRLATQKSWWDTVDSLDGVAGILVRSHPKLAKRMETLGANRNFWLRRIAIQHQLTFAEHTDAERLFRICLANAADPEIFIRKAIGWALRDYARTDPDWVRRYVEDHRGALSGLSIREASKHLRPQSTGFRQP